MRPNNAARNQAATAAAASSDCEHAEELQEDAPERPSGPQRRPSSNKRQRWPTGLAHKPPCCRLLHPWPLTPALHNNAEGAQPKQGMHSTATSHQDVELS